MAEFCGGAGERTDSSESKLDGERSICKEALDTYTDLFDDDYENYEEYKDGMQECKLESEDESPFDGMIVYNNIFVSDERDSKDVRNADTANDTENSEVDKQQEISYEPNSQYELNGDIFETDDNGKAYKKNGELLPNTEYTVNGNNYCTDENGNKISCDAKPNYTGDGDRNNKEQKESGGEERQDNDDGGHIIAKILGGSDGAENLVPMRRTINRGDYKKMENEIAKALQEGKEVTIHIDISYDGNSQRPSKINVEYTIDGKKTVVEFDNEEDSTDLLEGLSGKICDADFKELQEEINDMHSDGCNASVTSVKTEYDEKGSPTKITVGVLDESTGEKTYKVYSPKQ